MSRRRSSWPPVQASDVALAVAFAALSALLIGGLVDGARDRVVAGALVAAHVAPLLVRARWPLHALAAMGVTALLTVPLGVPVVALGPPVLVVLYSVGALAEPARARWAAAGTLLVSAVVVTANGMDAGTVATNTVGLAVAWWLGDRTRNARVESERDRALAADAVRHAAAAERLRIARELHDVVAHAMSVIAVQAGTGRFVIDDSPEVAKGALTVIEATSREALEEMRRLLAVLRAERDGSGELEPTPTLRDLEELVAATARAGVAVEVEVRGLVGPLPAGIELCAYRVVQEALTNVRKHAGASKATVSIRYEPDRLSVEVSDDGHGGEALPSGGHGLLGMEERVHLYGGTLRAGPRPCGFSVAAHIPLDGRP